MKLIVGLGNPGDHYHATRHNIGFVCIDAFIEKLACTKDFFELGREKKKHYDVFDFEYRTEHGICERIRCVKPLLFMNRSGVVVKELVRFSGDAQSVYSDLWVIHDEIALPFGQWKISIGRSSAGHNGVQSIIDHLHSQEFVRFRVGIAPQRKTSSRMRIESYVVQPFSRTQARALPAVVSCVCDALLDAIINGIAYAQSRTHVPPIKK